MKASRMHVLATALLMSGFWLSEATAQTRCREGVTRDGQCVERHLAERARQAAILFSQPKISAIAYPVLPSGDAGYRYPHELTVDPLRIGAAGVPLPPVAPSPDVPPSLPPVPPPSASGGSNPTGAAVIN